MKELLISIKKMFKGKESQMMNRSVKYDELVRLLEDAAKGTADKKDDGKVK